MADSDPANNAWEKVASILRRSVSRQQFETWFRGMRMTAISPDRVAFTVPNNFLREWILRKYTGILRNAAREVLGHDVELEILIAASGDLPQDGTVGGSPPVAPKQPAQNHPPAAGGFLPPHAVVPSLSLGSKYRSGSRGHSGSTGGSGGFFGGGGPKGLSSSPQMSPHQADWDVVLNSQYIFENFVPGPSNNFGFAAATAVADSPGKTYNPLFLHGSVGLGKTHLLQGICHRMIERRPDMRILYLSCETFVNHFVNAVANGELDSFRFRYRHVDVLLIDDIHFLAKRERTQEEFFHTFNTLYNANKQIILSSDSTPAEIPTLEERLVSRFKWGVVARIDPPHYETRIAIIARKARMHGMTLPEDVVNFVGESVRSNIRELEGAVNKLVSLCHITGKTIDIAMAREALRDIIPATPNRVSVDSIMRSVADRFSLSVRDITGKRRHRQVARARHICMFLARKMTTHSLEEIGGYIGGRDHTTIMHGFQRIREAIQEDPELAQLVDSLRNEVSRCNEASR